jgi:hypothetical protein
MSNLLIVPQVTTDLSIINPIDQVQAHSKTSSQYKFVNTGEIVDFMQSKGYGIAKTSIANSRKYQGYQKHILRFRAMELINAPLVRGDNIPEIIIVNSHQGSCALKVMLGIFRVVCSNGLIAGNSLFSESIMHKGFTYEKLGNALNSAVNAMPTLLNIVNNMKSKSINYTQACELAIKAIEARGIDTSLIDDKRVLFSQLFTVNRQEDKALDVYTVMNVIQENIINEPLRYRTIENKQKTSKRIKSLDVNLKVNQVLFEEALRLAA